MELNIVMSNGKNDTLLELAAKILNKGAVNLDEGRGKKGAARHVVEPDDWEDERPERKPVKFKINRGRFTKDDMRSRVNTESLDKLHEDDIVVEHAEFGVGSILDKNDTHAEVMFAEGVEVVKIDTLTVIDEARGRPPKNDDDPDGEANRNIVTQLHKVNNGTATHVKFNDGGKHPITASHARMAIEKHGSYEKPVDKASFQEKLGASHDSFKSSIGA